MSPRMVDMSLQKGVVLALQTNVNVLLSSSLPSPSSSSPPLPLMSLCLQPLCPKHCCAHTPCHMVPVGWRGERCWGRGEAKWRGGRREKDGERSRSSLFLQQLERDLLPSALRGPSKFCSVSGKMLARNTPSVSGDHRPALVLGVVPVRSVLEKDRNRGLAEEQLLELIPCFGLPEGPQQLCALQGCRREPGELAAGRRGQPCSSTRGISI